MSAIMESLIPYISIAVSCYALGYIIGFVKGRD